MTALGPVCECTRRCKSVAFNASGGFRRDTTFNPVLFNLWEIGLLGSNFLGTKVQQQDRNQLSDYPYGGLVSHPQTPFDLTYEFDYVPSFDILRPFA
jgi:hypothetical protein